VLSLVKCLFLCAKRTANLRYYEVFVARRFSFQAVRPFSRLIVRIAIAGIALGLSVMICSVAILTGFKGTIRNKLRGFNGDLQVTRLNLNQFENDPFKIDTKLFNRLRAVRGVTKVNAFANKAGILSSQGEIEGVILRGVSPAKGDDYLSDNLVAGKPLRLGGDTVSTDILISRIIANRLKIKAGDHVLMYFVQQPMRTRKLLVRGIYDLGMDELDKTFVIGDIRLIQRLNDWTFEEAGGLQLGLQDFGSMEAMQTSINKVLPVHLKVFTIKDIYQQLFDWLTLTDVNVQVILVLMLLVAGINMISALLIMILERTPAIGILKAMGSTDRSIREIFLGVSAYLIGLGMIIGNVIGLGFCLIQNATHAIKLNQVVYYMSYVPIDLNWQAVLLLNLGTLVACLVMLIVPSYLVTRINPLKAIRFK